ncbi:MFS general substrate transporter [Mytilinidion resinicola]|uniref:MFS general substrate transporter n=1 Tax=Mytilinidion resinicola TaxID=574789 RepID=A0A6A6Z9H0_9PEZI|nr:MFS general substrate transporter [Mytilinidion resinicola]KAF2817771.1 MFS general substrate transporter [Mytilinidion resinicola]
MVSMSEKEDQVTHEEFAKPVTQNPPTHTEQSDFETDESILPKGYFYSTFFLGSYAAIALGLVADACQPDELYVWVSLVYNVCSTVWFPIVGRFGDIFGRRYMMIAGALCAVIGSVICATAQSIPVLIGGNVFLGSASAVQLSFGYLLAELLPMKYRYFGTGTLHHDGFVIFLMGLSWGGAIYPWGSASVICAIVIGFVVLVCFVLWEVFGPIKQPLIPMRLFLNGHWTAAVVPLGLGARVYYAFTIVWPQQVAVLYANGDLMYTGYLSLIVGLEFITGQVCSGAATVTPNNKKTRIALLYIDCAFIGRNEGICLTNSSVMVNDQRDIGVAGGTAGCVRSGISAILTVIYTTVLNNRLTKTIAAEVPSALIGAGLPTTSVAWFLEALTAGTSEAFKSIPGISQRIIAVGTMASKVANANAYRTVYLTTIAFSGLAIILTWFARNTEEFMTGQVAATLNRQGKELEAKELSGENV